MKGNRSPVWARRTTLVTEGPVRFAPAAWEGKVYFVSDDGYLYCLNAADGSLRWRFRGLPEERQDRKVMGNGRLISLYPARGGPVLSDGVVYFAAGLWPTEGVFVHAIDAESGQPVWSNTDVDHIPASKCTTCLRASRQASRSSGFAAAVQAPARARTC